MKQNQFVSSFVRSVSSAVKSADGLLMRLAEQMRATPESERKAFQKALYAKAKTAGDRQYNACRKLWSLARHGKTSGSKPKTATVTTAETPLVSFMRKSAATLNKVNGKADYPPMVYAMLVDCMNEYKKAMSGT